MWFDDNRSAGKRLFIDVRKMSRNPGTRRNIRLGAKGDNANRTTMAVLLLGLGIACLALLWFALKKTGETFYSENDTYKIVHLDISIKGGKLLTEDLIRGYTHIEEGMNLFGFDAKRVRADVLGGTPNIKSMTITRQLPDTVKIEVVERDPVARFGSKTGFLVADRDGYVFNFRMGRADLPVILGNKEGELKPAMTVQGATRAALDVLEAVNDPRFSLRVDAIDVSPEDCLVLYMPHDTVVTEVKAAWNGMGTAAADSKKDLLMKLSWVAQVLQSAQGKKIVKLDATQDGSRLDATMDAP